MTQRVAAVAATLLAAVVPAGCGSSKAATQSGLAWTAPPHLLSYPNLPGDRLAFGKVRNRTEGNLTLDARQVRLLDRGGRTVPALVTARFLAGFAHGLYSPTQFGPVRNPFELERLGVRLVTSPGQELPLTVSWHLKGRAARPERVEVAGFSLPLPSR